MMFEPGTVQGSAPGRNSPCPCGSGKKYKKCCRAADEAKAQVPKQTVQEAHIPRIFDDEAMDADQDRLHQLLASEPTLVHLRYDRAKLDPFLDAGLPDNEAELDAEGWTDVMTSLAQRFHKAHAGDLDVVAALLLCGRTGDHDALTIRALANGVLHLALTDMSGELEMNLIAAEILRVTVSEAEDAGNPVAAFGGAQ
ncbi:MAG: SEC-C domain-containing protein [Myxococcales bacterium]|nr:SEC-C domain-containing protein [Myxococcales bacterium]